MLDAEGTPDLNESPDGGGENSETPETDAGQGTEEPEPTLDAGSESGNEATAMRDSMRQAILKMRARAVRGCERMLAEQWRLLANCLNTAGILNAVVFCLRFKRRQRFLPDINECEKS